MEKTQKWFCDVCGRIIDSPEKGYVVWNDATETNDFGYKILHANGFLDEHGNKYVCDKNHPYRSSMELARLMSYIGVAHLLSMLESGSLHKSIFSEIFRRLFIPYYEEARLYFDEAKKDDFFKELNEAEMSTPEILEKIIKKYRP